MREFNLSEKILKRYLKRKRSVSVALIVTFLITGGLGLMEELALARDLRVRTKEANIIKPDNGGPSLNTSANKTDVVNIVNPDASGISHNKFTDLSVGAGNGIIFNNSTEHGTSQIGGYVTKNPNLTSNAKTILNEVTGNNISNINGSVEIFGKKADFILANENGINVNGATFINTNGVTLTTGAISKDNSGINFDVQKGNILLNGVGTSGSYFNVLAKTIQIYNEISPIEGEARPDITLIAGQNKIGFDSNDLSKPYVKSSTESKEDKYGIYATELGAMYGRNIRLISTGQGLGVKHEGAIFSEGDIAIEANGNISVATLNAKKGVKLKGKDLETKGGIIKVAGKDQINSISAGNDIIFELEGNGTIRSAVQSTGGNIVISAKGLTLQDKTSARLISKNSITLKLSEKLDVQGVLIPTVSGVDSNKLVIVSNSDGSLQVKDIESGRVYSSEEITWVSTGIIGKDVEIFTKELVNKGIISADGKLTITAESLLNEKNALLKGSDLELIANSSFVNKGEIRENKKELNEIVDSNGKLKIEVLKGKFENYGNISAKDITITAQELINALNGKVIASDGNIILTTTVGELVNNGEILATKDLKLISANNLTNTGKLGADSILIQAVQGKFLNAGHITAVKDLVINVKELFNAGNSEEIEKYLGALYQYSEEELTKVENSISELNKKIAAEKDPAQLAELKATLSGLEEVKNKLNDLKDILSKTGMLGVLSGDNVKITTKESFENKGVVTSQKDLTLETGSVINSGVLQAGDNLLIEALGKIVNTQRITAGKKIIISGDSFVSNGNEERIKEYLELLQKLNSENLSAEELAELKAKIAAFSDLGVIEGETLAITTKTTLENNGIVITKGDVSLKSEDSIKNNGVMSVGKNLDVKGKSFSSKDLTIKENLSANISGDFNSYNLSVGGNVDITSSKLENSGKLETGGGLNLTGNFSNKSGATASVGKSLNINGGVNNSGELLVGETIKINSENRNNGESFANSGNINASGEIEIGGSSFDNTGKIATGSKLDINVSGDIDNSGNIEAKNDISLTGKNLNNKNGDLVTEGNLTANISEKVTNGNMSVGNDINITSNGFHNSGSTVAGGNISLNTKTGDFGNSGKLHAAGKIDLDSRSAANSGEIIGNGVDISTKGSFFNTGSLQSKGSIVINNTGDVILTSGEVKASGDISITGNNSDIKLNGKVLSEGKIDVKSKTGDIETGKVQALGDISISTEKDIINKGMIVSNSNINLSADGIVNEEGNTIWAGKDAVLNAMREIYNSLNANIVSQNDMKLSAKSITNDAGTIAAGGNLDIKADNLTNKSRVDVKYEIVDTESSKQTVRWDDTFNYHLDSTEIWIPVIENKSVVTDKATIGAEGNLNISGFSSDKAKVNNYSGTILAGKDMTIKGDILNETAYQNLNVVDLLKLIQVRLSWETRLYLTNAYGNSGVSFEGSLYDALTKGYFGRGREAYYKALALVDNPLLDKVLSSVLGSDWKGKDKPISQDKWNFDGSFKYYAANGNAQIIAGGNFTHTNGSLVNNGGESGGNKNVNVNIGDNSIEGVGSNLDVDISDINSIKEVGGVKYPHDVELATGSITIDGVTITAETGNLAGAIAVSGTVNPIIFIDIPKGENGIFKPVEGEPQPGKPIYETNIDFIDPDKFFGSDYFFEQLGYDKNKTSAVLGDAYYDYLLLKDIIQKGLGYTGNVSAEDIQTLIDNAAEISATLGLELGKALTQDQINNLEHDIVWYVEVEVNGQKVLAPQLYLGKNSRINIAQNQGNGGTSTIKVGGDLVSDNTSFDNTNGNIDAGGNIIIKSSGDINNNSSGGMGGGISSDKNIAVDAAGDVNMIGGSLKGDNVIVSGDNVNIESTLGVDEKGNQIISDKAGIETDNGIQIDAKNDVNIKGGSLTASGEEIKPEEEGGAPGFEEPAPEQPEVVKDVDYYKELFKKESADIIEGDAGSININAGGDVNIKDIHTVSSEFKHEYDNGGFAQSSSTSATSNGSNLQGSNININGENVNIVGSDLSTNDTKEDANKDALPGSININAKNDVNIEDSKDLIHQDQYQKSLGTVKGLLTQESSRKELEASLSHGSSIKTSGDLNVSAGNDVTLKGSDVTVGGNANIDAENDLNILDGRNEVKEEFNESRYQVFGGGRTDVKKSSSTSVGSNISVGGDLNANAGNNIKVVGGNISANGDTNLSAGNDISIEAGKNEYHEEKKELNIGLYVEGSAGIGGVGVTGSASTADMSTSSEISTEWGGESAAGENLDGSNEKTPTTSGRPHMDQIVSGEFGVKLESKNTTIDETTWTESQISGDNINISAGNKVDIGGGDYKATGDISISGKQVDSTKYTDERTENSSGFSIAVKNTAGVNSAIVDTINKGVQMDSAIKSGNANDGVLAAQGVGAVTNVIFNDAIGVTNKQSINVSIEDSTSKTTSENVNSVDAGGSVTIKATEGDINLNGVDVKAEDNINLDAKKDINITAAKKTSTENGFKVDLEAQLEESAGVSALWGANTDIGVGGSANLDITKKNSTDYENSTISAGGNISIKSGGDTNIDGGNVEAKKDVNLDIGGNLNIISKKSSHDNHEINANAGANVSIGAASNTIGKGEVGLSGGGGDIWSSGETVSQSGIKAGGNLNADIEGDLNIEGGILGSETGAGKVDVGGNINIKDITTKEQAGGAHITGSGGFTGDFGADGTIGDIKDKEVVSKGVIGVDNITVGGDVNINGEVGSVEDIYKDMENTQIVTKDIYQKGGDISLSGSTSNIKDVKDKVDSISSKFGGTSKTSGINKGNDSDGINVGGKSVGDSDRNSIIKGGDDKYSVLDKDNAFDLPQREDTGTGDVVLKDTAGETTITPEHYTPLGAEPPFSKKDTSDNSEGNEDLYHADYVETTGSDKKVSFNENVKVNEYDPSEPGIGDATVDKPINDKDINDNEDLYYAEYVETTDPKVSFDDKVKVNEYDPSEPGIGDVTVDKPINDKNINDNEDLYQVEQVYNSDSESDSDTSSIDEKSPEEQLKDLEDIKDLISSKDELTQEDKDDLKRLDDEIRELQEKIQNDKIDSDDDSSSISSDDSIISESGSEASLESNTFTENSLEELSERLADFSERLGKDVEEANKRIEELQEKIQNELDKSAEEQRINTEIENSIKEDIKNFLEKHFPEESEKLIKDSSSESGDDSGSESSLSDEIKDFLEKHFPEESKGLIDKYEVLDDDNAFDFPQREDTDSGDVTLEDTANEEKIVAEYYRPLGAEPPSSVGKKDDNSLTIKQVTSEIHNDKYRDQYAKLEKIEQSLQKEREKLAELLEKQKELTDKKLTDKDKKELEKLEKELRKTLDKISSLTKEQQKTLDKIDEIRRTDITEDDIVYEEIPGAVFKKDLGETESNKIKINDDYSQVKDLIPNGSDQNEHIYAEIDKDAGSADTDKNISEEKSVDEQLKDLSDVRDVILNKGELTSEDKEDLKQLEKEIEELKDKGVKDEEAIYEEIGEKTSNAEEGWKDNPIYESLDNYLTKTVDGDDVSDAGTIYEEVEDVKDVKKASTESKLSLKDKVLVGVAPGKAVNDASKKFSSAKDKFDKAKTNEAKEKALDAMNKAIDHMRDLESHILDKNKGKPSKELDRLQDSIHEANKDYREAVLKNIGVDLTPQPSAKPVEPPPYKNPPSYEEAIKSLNKGNGIENGDLNLKNNDKYEVLNDDNAFDFPQREDTDSGDVVLKDTAGESVIVAEHYTPLGVEPPSSSGARPKDPPPYKAPPAYQENQKAKKPLPPYKEPPAYQEKVTKNSNVSESISSLEKKIESLNKDIERVEKIEAITGGDFGTKTSLDDLKHKLEKTEKELSDLQDKALEGLSENDKKIYKDLSKELGNLTKRQEELTNKQPLSAKAVAELNKIEQELKDVVDKLNSISGKNSGSSQGDKYGVLSGDNAFDLPQREDTDSGDVTLKDTANEEKIVAEHYIPLGAEPPHLGSDKKASTNQPTVSKNSKNDNALSIKNVIKEIHNDKYRDQYAKLEKTEQKLQKEREKLTELLDKQAELTNKKLTNKDKKELDKLEKDLKKTLDKINSLTVEQQKIVDKIDEIRRTDITEDDIVYEQIPGAVFKKDLGEVENNKIKINDDYSQVKDSIENENDQEEHIYAEVDVNAGPAYTDRNSGEEKNTEEQLKDLYDIKDMILSKGNLTPEDREDLKQLEKEINELKGENGDDDTDPTPKPPSRPPQPPKYKNPPSYEEAIKSLNKGSGAGTGKGDVNLSNKATDSANSVNKTDFTTKNPLSMDKVAFEINDDKYIKEYDKLDKLEQQKQKEREKLTGLLDKQTELANKKLTPETKKELNKLEKDIKKTLDKINSLTQDQQKVIEKIEDIRRKNLTEEDIVYEEIPGVVFKKDVSTNTDNNQEALDKYAVLDGANAFDLPGDNGERAENLKDTANESEIKAEKYIPLGAEPQGNTEKTLDSLGKQLDVLQKVQSQITSKGQLGENDKKLLGSVEKQAQDIIKKIEEALTKNPPKYKNPPSYDEAIKKIKSPDKYGVLGGDNAFDLPNSNEGSVTLKDTANEPKIIPENYNNLNTKNETSNLDNTGDMSNEEYIESVKQDIERVQKIVEITGGDEGTEAIFKELNQKLDNALAEVGQADDSMLKGLSVKDQNRYKDLASDLAHLQSQQISLMKKANLDANDNAKLDKIQDEMENIVEILNKLETKLSDTRPPVPPKPSKEKITSDLGKNTGNGDVDISTERQHPLFSTRYEHLDNVNSSIKKNEDKLGALFDKQKELTSKDLTSKNKKELEKIEKELTKVSGEMNTLLQEKVKTEDEINKIRDIYSEELGLNTENDLLSGDNVFDFPKDNGERVAIEDTAGEKVVIPELYIPLEAGEKNTKLEEKKAQLEEYLDKLEIVKDIIASKGNLTNGDREDLAKIEKESQKILKELNKIIKEKADKEIPSESTLARTESTTSADSDISTNSELWKDKNSKSLEDLLSIQEKINKDKEKEKSEKVEKSEDKKSKNPFKNLFSKKTDSSSKKTDKNTIKNVSESENKLTNSGEGANKTLNESTLVRTESTTSTDSNFSTNSELWKDKNSKSLEDLLSIQDKISKDKEEAKSEKVEKSEDKKSKNPFKNLFSKKTDGSSKKNDKNSNKNAIKNPFASKPKADREGYKKVGDIYVKSEQEAKRQLDLALDNPNIPKEHLQDFAKRTFLNKGIAGPEEGKKNIVTEKITNSGEQDQERLKTLYDRIGNDFEGTRKEMNREVADQLANNDKLASLILGEVFTDHEKAQELLDIYEISPQEALDDVLAGKYMEGLQIDQEFVKDVAKIIDETRGEIFEKFTEENYKAPNLVFGNNLPGTTGIYSNGEMKIDLRQQNGIKDVINILLHEGTHNEQGLIKEGNSDRVEDSVRDLYAMNSNGGYIIPADPDGYKNQPVESEAFDAMKGEEIVKHLLDTTVNTLKGEIYVVSDKDFDDISISQYFDDSSSISSEGSNVSQEKDLNYYTQKIDDMLKQQEDIIFSPDIDKEKSEAFKEKYAALREEIGDILGNNQDIMLTSKEKEKLEDMLEKIERIDDRIVQSQSGALEQRIDVGNGVTVLTRSNKDILDSLKIVADNADKLPAEHLESYLKNFYNGTNEQALATKVKENIGNGEQIFVSKGEVEHDKASLEALKKIEAALEKKKGSQVALKEDNDGTKKSKKKANETPEVREKDRNNRDVITRSSKDVKDNLKKVAEMSKKLPPEHLTDYLGRVVLNSDQKEINRNNKDGESIVKNPKLDLDPEVAKNLGDIYASIYDKSDKTLNSQLDNELVNKLKSNSEINDLLTNNEVTKENLEKLAKTVASLKGEIYKDLTGKPYDSVNIRIKESNGNTNGELQGNVLTLYLRDGANMVDYLGTTVHELKHNDQRNIKKDSNEDGALPYLYGINSSKDGYIEPNVDVNAYKDQPIEAEAFQIQKEVLAVFKDGFVDPTLVPKKALSTKDKLNLKLNPDKLVSDATKGSGKLREDLKNSFGEGAIQAGIGKVRGDIKNLESLKKVFLEKNQDGKYNQQIKDLQKEINDNYTAILMAKKDLTSEQNKLAEAAGGESSIDEKLYVDSYEDIDKLVDRSLNEKLEEYKDRLVKELGLDSENAKKTYQKDPDRLAEELKNALTEYKDVLKNMYPNMKEEIDIAFKENSKEISDGARSYLEDVLKEKNSLPSKEELKELLDDAFVAELEKWRLKEQEEEFVRVDEGDRTLFLRTPEGVKKQLGLVAKDKNNIPSEHVQEFLANTFLDKGNKESIKKDDGNAVITNSSEVELDREAKKNLSSLYSKLDNNFKDTRDNMNKELINDLGKNKKLQDFILQGGKVDVDFLKLAYERQPEAVINSIYDMNIAGTSDEMIQNIYSAIQEGRKEVFEKALDVEYRPSDIVFTTSSDDSAEIASYNPKTENVEFYRDRADSFGVALDYLLHESQHHEQKIIANAKGTNKIPEGLGEKYKINMKGYITPDSESDMFGWEMYKAQPTEAEAFDVMKAKDVINSLVQNIISGTNNANQKNQNSNEQKLVKGDKEDIGAEGKLYGLALGKPKRPEEGNPSQSNINIETKTGNSKLGEIPLIFGESSNYLSASLAQGSNSGANKSANSYLAVFNGDDGVKRLEELAQKFMERTLTEEDLEDYSNYKVYGSSIDIFHAQDTDENRVSSSSNMDLLKELLGTQLGAQGLQKMYQGMKELQVNPDNQISKEKYKEGMKEFFDAKMIVTLNKTLNGGAQAYIDMSSFFTTDQDIDLEKVAEKIYDEDSDMYDSSEAVMLRYILEKHSGNPNVKYMLEGQLIDISEGLKNKISKK